MNLHLGLPGPVRVLIEPTTTCNLRCRHCGVNDAAYRHETLPWSTFERMLPFLRRTRPEVELYGHGESLACRRFPEMFRAVVEAGSRVSFLTNGMLLTPELVDQLLVHAGPRGWHTLNVSIDAATPELFAEVRRGARLETIVQNLAYLAEARGRRGLHHPVVAFNTVAMAMTVHELPGIVRLAQSVGAERVTVVDLLEYDFFQDQNVVHDFDHARPFFLAAQATAKETGVRFNLTAGIRSLLDTPRAADERPS